MHNNFYTLYVQFGNVAPSGMPVWTRVMLSGRPPCERTRVLGRVDTIKYPKVT
jgi:hypothetical protein